MNKAKTFRLILVSLLLFLLAGLTTDCAPAVQEVVASSVVIPTIQAEPSSTFTQSVRATLPIVVHSASPSPIPSPTPTDTPVPEPLRFAVIGDYGGGGSPEADVAALVDSWSPELVITVGDNNYPSGSADTIDAHIGQFYHQFIYPYLGEYGQGADTNRFFPTLGNHDWDTPSAQPHLDYFTLPGNERYYDRTWGPVHFFALDSDSREPDGVGSSSDQAKWLKSRLETSSSPWQIVFFHHAAYSSGLHGSTTWMRWPFASWGADAVLAGHDHTYERIFRDGIVYFVNGLGGNAKYYFGSPIEGSQLRYNDDYGAMLVEASPDRISFQFINRGGQVIDTYEITAP
jgi:tartrate-resistant acid phosphatase type 5